MKTYLIRAGSAGDARNTYLVPADDLTVRFPEINRVKRERYVEGLGSLREVEGTGRHDRTQFEMSAARDGRKATTATGSHYPFRYYRVKRSELKQHVRVLAAPDVLRVAEIDAHIEDRQRQIQTLRQERAGVVKDAWRRAAPANSLDLADAAEARI